MPRRSSSPGTRNSVHPQEPAHPFKKLWETALRDYLTGWSGTNTARRAVGYVNSAHILDATVDAADSVSARIVGSDFEPYETVVYIGKKGNLKTECSCPVGGECKHAVALALLLAWEAVRRDAELAGPYNRFFPTAWDVPSKAPEPDLLSNAHLLFASPDRKKTASSPGSPRSGARAKSAKAPPAPPRPWWISFLESKDEAERYRILARAAGHRLSGQTWYGQSIADNLMRHGNPVAILRKLDLFVEREAEHYRHIKIRPRDPEFQAFLESEEAHRIQAEFDRQISEERFMAWLNKPAEGEAQPGLSQNLSDLHVTWETRPSEQGIDLLAFQVHVLQHRRGFTARASQGLTQLASEVRSKKRAFPGVKSRFVLWVAERNEVFARRYSYNSYEGTEGKTRFAVTDVFAWISLWGNSDFVRWEDGSPVRLMPGRATLTIAPGPTGRPRWVLQVPPSEDEPPQELPLSEAQLVTEAADLETPRGPIPRIFLRRGGTLLPVDSGDMTVDVLAAARVLQEIPVERLQGSPAGNRLARRLAQSSPEGARNAYVAEVPVTPVAEFRFSDGSVSWSASARTAEGDRFLRYGHGVWEPAPDEPRTAAPAEETSEQAEPIPELSPEDASLSTAASAEAADAPPLPVVVLARVPRPSDVAALDDWLESLPQPGASVSTPPGHPEQRTWKLTPAALGHILERWIRRPKKVEYLGDRAFRELVEIQKVPRFTVSIEKSGIDWLQVSVETEEEMEALSLAEVLRVLSTHTGDLVMLRGGRAYRREELEQYRDQVEQLAALGLTPESGKQRLHALHLAGAPKGTLEKLDQSHEDLHRLASSAREVLAGFKGIPHAPVAPGTATFLRPYQRHGADFLAWACHSFGGAVLADDMGLGKTLQVLAALTALSSEKAEGTTPDPTLVVCPASVAHNWQREAHKFAPQMKVCVLESGKQRLKQLQKLARYDLVVINYALLRRDAEILAKQPWLAVVVDEAQAIKNPQADTTRVVKTLKARCRIALTGTPIENRIADLWSIVDFALPGYLSGVDAAGATSSEPAIAARFYQLLRARLRPVLLRRVKSEVAPELPERIETRMDCTMSAAQRRIYLAELKRARGMLDDMAPGQIKGAGRIQMLAALTRLRQICCDPALLGHSNVPSAKLEELMEEVLPPILEGGHKVLLFSQFVKMLQIIEKRLRKNAIPYHILTGESRNRPQILDSFEKSPEAGVFLISLKAGGTGLNLTSATHVVLYDPWWNPAVEAQAIDRTHRIGQDKTVVAVRMVTEQTIEERILELQEKKISLVRNVLNEDAFNRTLTRDDLEYLLSSGETDDHAD